MSYHSLYNYICNLIGHVRKVIVFFNRCIRFFFRSNVLIIQNYRIFFKSLISMIKSDCPFLKVFDSNVWYIIPGCHRNRNTKKYEQFSLTSSWYHQHVLRKELNLKIRERKNSSSAEYKTNRSRVNSQVFFICTLCAVDNCSICVSCIVIE